MTSTISIAEQVGQLEAGMKGHLPEDVAATFAAYKDTLIVAGIPSGVASPGTPVPDMALIDARGAETSLHAVTGDRPAVVVFYRGVWCPYCNVALKTYQEQLLPLLVQRGVGLVAVSPQKPDGSLSMQQKHELAFPVVSDPGNTLAARLGIQLPARSAEVAAAQAKLGLDLTSVNADGSESLPMPTVAIIDAGHVLRWIDVHPDYTTRTEVPDILTALDQVL